MTNRCLSALWFAYNLQTSRTLGPHPSKSPPGCKTGTSTLTKNGVTPQSLTTVCKYPTLFPFISVPTDVPDPQHREPENRRTGEQQWLSTLSTALRIANPPLAGQLRRFRYACFRFPHSVHSPACPVDSYCVPDFDSPSIFARILDKDKGGHFSITPSVNFSTKQSYLPSSNVRARFPSSDAIESNIRSDP